MRFKLTAVLLVSASGIAGAQTPVSPPGGLLTLDDAVSTARRNNPAYLQVANDERVATAQVRNARMSLLTSKARPNSSAQW